MELDEAGAETAGLTAGVDGPERVQAIGRIRRATTAAA